MAFDTARYQQAISVCSNNKIRLLLDYMYRSGHDTVKLECIEVLSAELRKRGAQYDITSRLKYIIS